MSDSRIITEEKANELDRAIGAIPIGKYVRSNLKREYKCTKCDSIYLATHKDTKKKHRTTCVKCSIKNRAIKKSHTIKYIYEECIKCGFEPLFDTYTNIDEKKLVRCKCGKEENILLYDIISKKRKTCSHCNDPKIGDKIGNLTIKQIKKAGHSCSILCVCDCGNKTKWYQYNVVKRGGVLSCGYCCNSKIGDVYGQLKVIEVTPGLSGKGCQVKCECSCGNIISIYNSKLKNGNNTSCGNCNLKRNNRFTSYTALRLHNIIENVTHQKWKHNYHIKGIGCIDIANPELKIAIEYDGYYNHMIRCGDRSKKDKEKIDKLIQAGWKVLNIKSGGIDFPSTKQLYKILLYDFQNCSKKRTITMRSWKKMEQKYANK